MPLLPTIPSRPPPKRASAAAAFDEESESEEDKPQATTKAKAIDHGKRKREPEPVNLKYARLQEQTLEEDPTAYDYDAVYDQMKQIGRNKVQNTNKEKDDTQTPKYMSKMLENAAQRQRNEIRIQERKIQRELEEDIKVNGQDASEEKFVTGAYKEFLDQVAKEEEEERRIASGEIKRDFSGFNRNMLDNMAADRTVRLTRDPNAKSGLDMMKEEETRGKAEISGVLNDAEPAPEIYTDYDPNANIKPGLNIIRKKQNLPSSSFVRQGGVQSNNVRQGGSMAGRSETTVKFLEDQLVESQKAKAAKVVADHENTVSMFKSKVSSDAIAAAKARAAERKKKAMEEAAG